MTTDQPPAPIRVRCEGSVAFARNFNLNATVCPVCGVTVTCADNGIIYEHERNDVQAMIERGDFDRPSIANDFLIGTDGDMITWHFFPRAGLTKEQAIRAAAWMVALADPMERTFHDVLKAVLST